MFGSKTFNRAQMKYWAYTKEFLLSYIAFDAFRHLIWGNTKPTLVLTDNKSLIRFFQAKHMAPSLWNHIDQLFSSSCFSFFFTRVSYCSSKKFIVQSVIPLSLKIFVLTHIAEENDDIFRLFLLNWKNKRSLFGYGR